MEAWKAHNQDPYFQILVTWSIKGGIQVNTSE